MWNGWLNLVHWYGKNCFLKLSWLKLLKTII